MVSTHVQVQNATLTGNSDPMGLSIGQVAANQTTMQYTSRHPHKSTDSQTPKSNDSEWLDEVFDLLSSSRRRTAILTVMEHENISKRELIVLVTASEYGMSTEEVPGTKERQTVHTSLNQTHLPRLEKADIIERDESGDRIRLGPKADELMEFMEHEEDSLGSKLKRTVAALC